MYLCGGNFASSGSETFHRLDFNKCDVPLECCNSTGVSVSTRYYASVCMGMFT